MVAFVTIPVIETVGVGLIDLEKPAVIVTTSERASKLSSALCVRVTLTLELQTPHSGCLDVSALQVALALVLKA
jgi:hypothetical protein